MNKKNFIPITFITLFLILCVIYFFGAIGSVLCFGICIFYFMLLRFD